MPTERKSALTNKLSRRKEKIASKMMKEERDMIWTEESPSAVLTEPSDPI